MYSLYSYVFFTYKRVIKIVVSVILIIESILTVGD